MGLCKECIKEVNTDKTAAGACYYICDDCSINDVCIYLNERSGTTETTFGKNFLHGEVLVIKGGRDAIKVIAVLSVWTQEESE